MYKFFCPNCGEPLLVHISDHQKIGFCLNCHQEMPLIEGYGVEKNQSNYALKLSEIFASLDHENKKISQDFMQTDLAGFWIFDRDHKTSVVNQKMANILGYTVDEMLGQPLEKFLDKSHPAFSQVSSGRLQMSREEIYQLKLRHQNGSLIWVDVSMNALINSEHRLIGYLCYVIDRTNYKQIEHKYYQHIRREKALHKLTQVIRTSQSLDKILMTAVQEIGKIIPAASVQIVQYIADECYWLNRAEYCPPLPLGSEANPRNTSQTFRSLRNQEFTQLKSRRQPHLELSPPSIPLQVPPETTENSILAQAVKIDSEKVYEFIQTFPGAWLPVPLYYQSDIWGSLSIVMRNPMYHWHESDLKLIENFVNQLSIAIAQSELSQQLEIARQKLQYLSGLDPLTQLPDRTVFNQALAQKWQALSQQKSSLSLILCDVNAYPFYKEKYGDHTADRFLKKVARTINRIVHSRKYLVARYSETEFAILLPHTNAAQAIQSVEKIQAQVELIKITTQPICDQPDVSISFGVACTKPQPGSSEKQLSEAAEQALDRGASQFCKCLLSQKFG